MMRINLLPWREKKRAQRKKRFFILHALNAIGGLFILLGGYHYIAWHLDNQIIRNQILEQEINIQEQQTKEIMRLKKEQETLIAGTSTLQNLQTSRLLMAHFLDELSNIIPSTIYLTQLERKNNVVTLWGHCESTSNISILMRNIENNHWMQNPVLIEIKKIEVNKESFNNEFQLNFVLKAPEKSGDS